MYVENMGRVVLGIAATALIAVAHGTCEAQVHLDSITLPDGFSIEVYAEGVPNARSMARSESGVLFVGTRKEGNVYALVDSDNDYKADTKYVLGSGLNMPNGVAFRDGALYVAEVSRLLRFDGIENHLEDPPKPTIIYDDYPAKEDHGWKYIAFGPDGYLYVPVGAPCNICDPDEEIYASITRIKPDGTDRQVFAHGVRNTVGFDWDPTTGDLWFTDNGRDMMGDDVPPEELNHAPTAGLHFGYPYVHGGDILDPQFGEGHNPSDYVTPALNMAPHAAALGMKFYTGTQFPENYRGGIFIAEHGSWNRSEKIGYRVQFVPMVDGKPAGYETFAEGWLQGKHAWGRPVDVLVLPDGSMLVSDDQVGVIYRIAYHGGT